MKNGFFVSCVAGYTKEAFKEVVSLLNSLETSALNTQLAFDSDLSQLLRAELKELKRTKNFRKFEESRSLLFIENTTDAHPSEIHQKIIEKGPRFRKALRVIPLDVFGVLSNDTIESYITRKDIKGSFKITFQGRLCPDDTKERLFGIILPLIHEEVNLNNPQYEIIVQAFKKYVGLAVLPHSQCLFNFHVSHQ